MERKRKSGQRAESGDGDADMGKEDCDWIGGGDILVLEDLEAGEIVYKRVEDCAKAKQDDAEGGEGESTLAEDEVNGMLNASSSAIRELSDSTDVGNRSA